jgi:hypothetical protein
MRKERSDIILSAGATGKLQVINGMRGDIEGVIIHKGSGINAIIGTICLG